MTVNLDNLARLRKAVADLEPSRCQMYFIDNKPRAEGGPKDLPCLIEDLIIADTDVNEPAKSPSEWLGVTPVDIIRLSDLRDFYGPEYILYPVMALSDFDTLPATIRKNVFFSILSRIETIGTFSWYMCLLHNWVVPYFVTTTSPSGALMFTKAKDKFVLNEVDPEYRFGTENEI